MILKVFWKEVKFHLNLTLFSLFTNRPNMVLCTVKYQYHTSWHIVVSWQFDVLEGTVPAIWIGVVCTIGVENWSVRAVAHCSAVPDMSGTSLADRAPVNYTGCHHQIPTHHTAAASLHCSWTSYTGRQQCNAAALNYTIVSSLFIYLSELNVCILTKNNPRLFPIEFCLADGLTHTHKTKH